MFFGSEAPAEWRKQPSNHKDYKHFHVVVKTSLEYSPVALAYTTLARGSLFCSCSTALPILVDVAFLALWHSSNTIYKHGAVKGIFIATIQRCVILIQFSNLHTCWSGIVRIQTVKDTTPSKSGPHQSRICLSRVRCWPPAWLSPIRAE